MSDSTETAKPQSPNGTRSGRSHLAAGAKLSGDLSVPGVVELLGQVDGIVSADMIVIEETGSVVGELRATSIAIKGRCKGKIDGAEIRLHAGAQVSGEISYSTLTIESGARIDATCSRKPTT